MTRGPRSGPTAHLAALLRPAGPARPLPEEPRDWEALLRVADQHRLCPALWSSLVAHGAVRPIPAAVRIHAAAHLDPGRDLPEAVLSDLHERNALRVAQLLEHGRAILTSLTDAGIRTVPIKGLDALLGRRYPDPAARTMTDLDLLVDADRAQQAWEHLRGLGYEPITAVSAEHHLPALVCPGRPGSVEIHTALLRGRWRSFFAADAMLHRSTPEPGRPGLRLHPDDAAAIQIAHAQLQDEGRVLLDLPLRAIHETALLLAGPQPSPVDWRAVERAFVLGGAGAALRSHLHLVELLLGVSSPLAAGRRDRAHARAVLLLADRPRARQVASQVAFVPRSFSAERMTALHGGPGTGPRLWWTRGRHAVAGVRRRLEAGRRGLRAR